MSATSVTGRGFTGRRSRLLASTPATALTLAGAAIP